MTIPENANGGDVFPIPNYQCPCCESLIGVQCQGDMHVGSCMCGREWHIPVQRIAAYYLTEKQVEDARVDRETVRGHEMYRNREVESAVPAGK